MKIKKIILFLIISSSISGCSLFTPPIEKPIIEDHSGNLGTLATVAERRMVVAKKDYNKDSWFNSYESKFCAEPSPDATQSLANALSFALKGSAEGLKEKPELSAQFSKSLATTAKSLFHRSQGVQLFRDGLYNLCQAYLNGAITGKQYYINYIYLLSQAAIIISAEVDKLPSASTTKAEEAASTAELAKAAAENAKVIIMNSLQEVNSSLNKAKSAATNAENSQDEAKKSEVAAAQKVKEAEAAAKRAEDAANDG